MKAASTLKIFIASLVLFPAFLALVTLADLQEAERLAGRALFGATALLEAVALVYALRVWRLFSPGEPNRRLWSLIVAYFAVLLVAELRLAIIYLGLVPEWITRSAALHDFYHGGLRYLYVAADLLFLWALIVVIQNFRSTGLPFSVEVCDFFYIALLGILPVAAYLLHENMALDKFQVSGRPLQVFRIVSVTTNTGIACLCVVVRRYAWQMGGGALAGIWNAVVVAGIAGAASFLAFALLSVRWMNGAEFFEQYLLWIFAGCWLVAILRQRELINRLPG